MDIYKTNKFNDELIVINLAKEYEGYKGDVRYAIVSDLSEEELCKTREDEIKHFRPFVIISTEMYAAICESKRNDQREQKRDYLYHNAYALNDDRVPANPNSDPAVMEESAYTMEHIINKMRKLPRQRGRRMYQHYILGYSVEEISKIEGVSKEVVYESLRVAKREMRKIFAESEVEV